MNKTFYFILIPVFAFCSSGNSDYDIAPRTINFLIFFAILYYLLAKPFKEFYKNRINSISFKLENIQKKLLDSKNKKLESMKKLENAKLESANAIAMAKQEAQTISENIKNEAKEEILLLEKHFEDRKSYEIKKMKKDLINKIIFDLFKDDSLNLSQEDMINIVFKKVS